MIRKLSVALLGLLLVAAGASSTRSPHEPQFDFDIPSLPLADALAAFGKQANFDILYSIAPTANSRRAPALHGRFTVHEALDQLLKDSGGEYVKVADDMIVFRIP